MTKKSNIKSKCYCISLRRATNAVTEIYDNALKPINLSVNQYSLIVNLSRLGTCSVSDLAYYVRLDRTTVVRSLKPLFQLDYIEDISSVEERNRKIQLTDKGFAILEKGKPLWENAQHSIENILGEENIKSFVENLYALLDK